MFTVGSPLWGGKRPLAWAAATMPSFTPQSVANGGGIWVIGGISGANAYSVLSSNGTLWAGAATPVGSATGYGQSSTASSGSAFVSVVNAVVYGYSVDGNLWSQRAKGSMVAGRIRYLNANFVILGGASNGLQVSTDNGLTFGAPYGSGLSWTASDIGFGGGTYMLVTSGNFATSANLTTWVSSAAPWTATSSAVVAYGAGAWVVLPVGGATNTAYLSTNNGTTWVAVTLPATLHWVDLIYSTGARPGFMAICSDATTTAISATGATWIAGSPLTTTGFGFLAGNNAGGFVAVPQAGPTTLVDYGH